MTGLAPNLHTAYGGLTAARLEMFLAAFRTLVLISPCCRGTAPNRFLHQWSAFKEQRLFYQLKRKEQTHASLWDKSGAIPPYA